VRPSQLLKWNGEPTHPELAKLIIVLQSVIRKQEPSQQGATGKNWIVDSKRLDWTGVNLVLRFDEAKEMIEYRNHFKYEAVYHNGVEVCRGGDSRTRHAQFQFYLKQGDEAYLCFVEPIYGLAGRLLTGRVAGLALSIDGINLLV